MLWSGCRHGRKMWWFGRYLASTVEGWFSTLEAGDVHARRAVLHRVRRDRPPVVNRIATFERLFGQFVPNMRPETGRHLIAASWRPIHARGSLPLRPGRAYQSVHAYLARIGVISAQIPARRE